MESKWDGYGRIGIDSCFLDIVLTIRNIDLAWLDSSLGDSFSNIDTRFRRNVWHPRKEDTFDNLWNTFRTNSNK